jgi:hypothetical protein
MVTIIEVGRDRAARLRFSFPPISNGAAFIRVKCDRGNLMLNHVVGHAVRNRGTWTAFLWGAAADSCPLTVSGDTVIREACTAWAADPALTLTGVPSLRGNGGLRDQVREQVRTRGQWWRDETGQEGGQQ